jgi:hypothetical protein
MYIGCIEAQVSGQNCMPHELISGIVGAAIGRLVSKFSPARRTGEFSNTPFEMLERRNKWLYRGVLAAFCLGFLTPYALFPPGAEGRVGVGHSVWFPAWFAGAMFGLPFSAILLFAVVTWLALGKQRARELLFYFEVKQKTNIYVFYVLGALLAPTGIISLFLLCRA